MDNDIIVGRNPVIEALKAGSAVEKIFILHDIKGPAIDQIRALARERHVSCVEISKQKFQKLTTNTNTQGIVATISTKTYVDVNDILRHAANLDQVPFILILDGIEDPQNLGALIRTAECAGVHGTILPKHHSATINTTVTKTSAGASEHMLVAQVTNIVSTMDELKKNGVWIIGTDTVSTKTYMELDYTIPVALVIGNEGKGIRRLVREKCDFLVRIPMFGKIQSLNASVAGALVMYEVVRHRMKS